MPQLRASSSTEGDSTNIPTSNSKSDLVWFSKTIWLSGVTSLNGVGVTGAFDLPFKGYLIGVNGLTYSSTRVSE